MSDKEKIVVEPDTEITGTPEENGIIFFENRLFDLPTLDTNLLQRVFGDNSRQAAKYIKVLRDYLSLTPVGDSFGSNHLLRQPMTRKYWQRFGEEFHQKYYDQNKFRGNKISVAKIRLEDLTEIFEGKDHSWLVDFKQRLTAVTNRFAYEYGELESLETKLEIIHQFEDLIVEILNKIASSD